jgi:hypothetical protein
MEAFEEVVGVAVEEELTPEVQGMTGYMLLKATGVQVRQYDLSCSHLQNGPYLKQVV